MPDFASMLPVMPNRPTTAPSIPSFGPSYADILASMRNSSAFKDAYSSLTPSAPGTLDPGYQSTLDQIKSNAAYYGGQASSAAQALAARRGLAGSSIEQFGVQAALNNVNRTAADQTAAVYQQNLERQQQLQSAQANALFGVNNAAGGLASDEVASQRNMAYQQQMLALQQSLGQQGIDIARENIGASKDIANKNGIFNLIGALGPSFLGKMFPGSGGAGGGAGGGFFGNLFGGGGAGAEMTAGAYNTAAPSGMAYSTMMPGGMGAVGTPGMVGAGGAGGLAGFAAANPGLALAGAAAGAMALANYGGKIAGPVGSFFANPIGAQLNIAKSAISGGGNAISNVSKIVSKSISNVFPF